MAPTLRSARHFALVPNSSISCVRVIGPRQRTKRGRQRARKRCGAPPQSAFAACPDGPDHHTRSSWSDATPEVWPIVQAPDVPIRSRILAAAFSRDLTPDKLGELSTPFRRIINKTVPP